MPQPKIDDDPLPVPPEPPEDEDCCHGGCEHCVYDLYEQARERYQEARREGEELRRRAF